MDFDYHCLKSTMHMLKWLHPNPANEISKHFQDYLSSMVEGARLVQLEVTSDPDWLTGGKKSLEDETIIALSRTGMAFEFRLVVETEFRGSEVLEGVYTWVGNNLDKPEEMIQRNWFDINGKLEEFGKNGHLMIRIYLAE